MADNRVSTQGPLHVAAAVVVDLSGRILLALRPADKHQGGLWEFPGGKVEPGEDVATALRRELYEEVGIEVTEARPLIRIPFDYTDRRVLLDVWRVERYSGEAHGREGQAIRWVEPGHLDQYRMPAANLPIATAARLPELYLITPDPGPAAHWASFLIRLEAALTRGIRLVQWRAKGLEVNPESRELVRSVIALCHRYGAQVLRNSGWHPGDVDLGFDGIHLTSTDLLDMTARPADASLVAASCHDEQQLHAAAKLGVDFAVVSPVAPTASHPEAVALGWERFHALCEIASIPVYALGGVGPEDLRQCWAAGGQGVAAIRTLWNVD